MSNTSMRDKIYERLHAKFNPSKLEVIDESLEHTNTPSEVFKQSAESHFHIYIWAKAFTDKTTYEKHQMIQEVIAFAYEEGVHSIRINAISRF